MTRYPSAIQIETSTRCSGKCYFCPHGKRKEQNALMSEECFLKIVHEVASWPVKPMVCCPFMTNEPFEDERMIEWCRVINLEWPKTSLVFFTNGAFLDEAKCRELLTLQNVDLVHFTISSADWAIHAGRTGLDLFKTYAAIDRLSRSLKVALHVISPAYDEIEMAALTARFASAPVSWGSVTHWAGQMGKPKQVNPDTTRPCPRSDQLCILWDGRVALCCLDYDGKYSPGNINERPLLDIYNDQGRWDRLSNRNSEPCNECEA